MDDATGGLQLLQLYAIQNPQIQSDTNSLIDLFGQVRNNTIALEDEIRCEPINVFYQQLTITACDQIKVWSVLCFVFTMLVIVSVVLSRTCSKCVKSVEHSDSGDEEHAILPLANVAKRANSNPSIQRDSSETQLSFDNSEGLIHLGRTNPEDRGSDLIPYNENRLIPYKLSTSEGIVNDDLEDIKAQILLNESLQPLEPYTQSLWASEFNEASQVVSPAASHSDAILEPLLQPSNPNLRYVLSFDEKKNRAFTPSIGGVSLLNTTI